MNLRIKAINIALLSTIILATSTIPSIAIFPDILSNNYYYNSINYVQEEEIVQGFSDGTYRFDQSITRAEFTKIIISSLFQWQEYIGNEFNIDQEKGIYQCLERNKYIKYSGTNPNIGDGAWDTLKNLFPDVNSESKFAPYICMSIEENILTGYSDGTFKPEQRITVAEASKIISNAYKFTDIQSMTETDKFQPFLDALISRNALPTLVYNTDAYLLRGDMASIIYRLNTGITKDISIKYAEMKHVGEASCNDNGGEWTYDQGDEGCNIPTKYVWYEDMEIKFMYPENWNVSINGGQEQSTLNNIRISNDQNFIDISQAIVTGEGALTYNPNNPYEYSYSYGGTSTTKINALPIIQRIDLSSLTNLFEDMPPLEYLMIFPKDSRQDTSPASIHLSYLENGQYISPGLIWTKNILLDENPHSEYVIGNFINLNCSDVETTTEAQECIESIEKFFQTSERKN